MSEADQHLPQDSAFSKPALMRGARLKCPRCGKGRIFAGFLKVAPQCNSCGLDLSPQRADDGPAYAVIFIVGHVVGVLLPIMFIWFESSPLLIALTLSLVSIVMSLLLLPSVKGALVSYQWVKGMHGFGKPGE